MAGCDGKVPRPKSRVSIGILRRALPGLGLLAVSSPALAQLVPGSMDVHWYEGQADCASSRQPPLQLHRYNERTFLLRENICITFEAPFLYLLNGSQKALLIDTGDVADTKRMPLSKTVMDLLPNSASGKLPLLVVHTHRHLDHRAGDVQFEGLPRVQVVGFDIDSVRNFYHFSDWPDGLAQIDLGDRSIDVIPTPGHNETEVSFYDRETGLLFSGDFLLAGRLLIDDTSADLLSAERVRAFAEAHPVSYVLGGHIELNSDGETFPWQSQFHPREHLLQLGKEDLLALPAAIRRFNGFYTISGKYTLMNSMRVLLAQAAAVVVAVAGLLVVLLRYLRRLKRARGERAAGQSGRV